jgi:purine-nucleoside phosphorylase
MTLKEMTDEACAFLRTKTAAKPDVGIVLGSGLGGFAERLEAPASVPYGAIPHFARSTAPGHAGRLLIGGLGGKTALCMQGRFHFYEGYTMKEITFPVRLMASLGIKTLILTNACGGLKSDFAPGSLMLISDHINFMGANPLTGPNEDSFGTRFPDMTSAYTPSLRQLALDAARKLGIALKEGVYVGYPGPSFETPAEVRLFRSFGASAVGMSTVPETIAAVHCGMRVLALSCVTNLAAGISGQPITGDEVIEAAKTASADFTRLLTEIIGRL